MHYALYNDKACVFGNLSRLDDLDHMPVNEGQVLWLDVRGLGTTPLLEDLGKRFHIHPLALADLVNVPQRPKSEAYGDLTLTILHMLTCDASGSVSVEQLGVVFGPTWVITVQERNHDGDVLEPVRDRIRSDRGRIRKSGADYLAYALLDAVVDAYFPALDQLGRLLEDLEELALMRPKPATGRRIYELKRSLLHVRRAAWPMREALASLHRDDTMFSPTTRMYVRDAVDHATQAVDLIETYREFASSLMDLYLSSVNNRMNEVVKVLTIISTIFLPLSFIAGVYGMNFDTKSPFNMPELTWSFGYEFALGLMVLVSVAMLVGFKRAGWLGRDATDFGPRA
jgi:magnesium transporter